VFLLLAFYRDLSLSFQLPVASYTTGSPSGCFPIWFG
jgi:hypothetical protein